MNRVTLGAITFMDIYPYIQCGVYSYLGRVKVSTRTVFIVSLLTCIYTEPLSCWQWSYDIIEAVHRWPFKTLLPFAYLSL